MSQENNAVDLVSKRDEVMPQVYFVASLLIGIICGIATGILCRMILDSMGPNQILVIGLLCGLGVGVSFGAFKLNDAVAGGIAGGSLGIGLGLALGPIVVIFALFFSLGAVLGLGIGYGLRYLHYKDKKRQGLRENMRGGRNLPSKPWPSPPARSLPTPELPIC